jgi:alpha-1,3-rhamnosyltransferase
MSDISVVVPSYNHALFIEQTLRSIFAQTLLPQEVIVIDDGSIDDSPAIIERTLLDCPVHSELIVSTNRGISATLNEGLERSTGGFFAYLGSDDLWLPKFLEQQTQLLNSRPEAILAFCNGFVIDEDDNIIDVTDNWCGFPDGDLVPTLLAGDIFPSPGVVYRTDPLRNVGWNESSALEDYELYLRLSAAGGFARNPRRLCAWRQHSKNTSSSFPKMLAEHIAAQDRTMEVLGITREQLDVVQKRLKFKGVADCIRRGYRGEALKLFTANLGGARSLGHMVSTAFRLMVPAPLFRMNLIRKRRRNTARFGKLRITADVGE